MTDKPKPYVVILTTSLLTDRMFLYSDCLARLAERSQVLVVTHSPQVAARAAHHYRIEKSSDGTVTRTSVRRLTEDERREEIARMLSGAAVTDEARAQAAKLLEAA